MFYTGKIYIKQALRILKDNRYVSFISIIGTALAIGMIMAMIISDRARTMNLTPEVNRERTLYVKWIGVKEKKSDNIKEYGFMSLKTIKECFQSLKIPEAVTVTTQVRTYMASVPGGGKQKSCYVISTDDVFWKVYEFKFLEGSPYSKTEFDSGIKKIVINKQLARTLFGSDQNITGKQVQLNYVNYTICGIVDNISLLTDETFAHAWIPYSSTFVGKPEDTEGMTGRYKCQILAHSSRDFAKIRKEVDEQVKKYNTALNDYQIELFQQPDNKFTESKRFGPGYPDMDTIYIKDTIIIIIVLLVPAINLSGFTLSKMRQRMPELGIRKAFGCTKGKLIRQIISENMLYSLIGGILGLFISYVSLYLINKSYDHGFNNSNYWGLNVTIEMPSSVFINPGNFLLVFLFCAGLNILSACIPALKVSSVPIVESLKE